MIFGENALAEKNQANRAPAHIWKAQAAMKVIATGATP
jgi:hypothetical protein